MGDTVTGRQLIRDAMTRAGLDIRHEDLLFDCVSLDFRVRVGDRLPFAAHRLGMAAITLCGTVYLLRTALQLDAHDLLPLLRHEAEHVRQQRENPRAFYARYVWDWARHYFGDRAAWRIVPPSHGPRWFSAYRNIGAEREAQSAESALRRRLGDLERNVDQQIVLRDP